MRLTAPALHVRSLEVYKALFQAQIDDTIGALRENLRDWSAVHVVVLQAGALRRGSSNEEMARTVLQKIAPDGAPLEPDVALDDAKVPEGTIVSVMPDAIVPKIATQYDGWTYLRLVEFRRRMKEFETRALGAPTPGGIVDALFALKNHPIALDSGGTTGAPQFLKALEMVCPKEGTVWFCDSQFGFSAPASTLFAQAGGILHMPGRTREMLYFGDAWFAAFQPNGRVRVAMIEEG